MTRIAIMISALRQHLAARDFRKNARRLLTPLLVVAMVFYFTFHVLSGEHGLYALFKEERKLARATAELETLTAKRKELEHRARLLDSRSLDLDLLDEEARHTLGLAGANEIVIPVETSKDE
jgi:cell division protein FtsB